MEMADARIFSDPGYVTANHSGSPVGSTLSKRVKRRREVGVRIS